MHLTILWSIDGRIGLNPRDPLIEHPLSGIGRTLQFIHTGLRNEYAGKEKQRQKDTAEHDRS